MDKVGVDAVFTPDKPVYSPNGAVVTNIAHIPAALSAVMRENATRPDFAPEGSLALKAWFGSDRGLDLPEELKAPVVDAMAPYNEQIRGLNRQIGALFPRQSMKDTSGASQMDPKTQVTSLHGVPMLDAALHFCTSTGARTIASWSTWRLARRSTWPETRRWRPHKRRAKPATRPTVYSPRRRAL